jgi:hypothetical protein
MTTPRMNLAWVDALTSAGAPAALIERLFRRGIVSPGHYLYLTENDARTRSLAHSVGVPAETLIDLRGEAVSRFPEYARPPGLHYAERFASGLLPREKDRSSPAHAEETRRERLHRHYLDAATDIGELNDDIDLRDRCHSVRDQLDVGSCWVFGTLGTLETVSPDFGRGTGPKLSEKFLFQDIKANGKDPFPDIDGGRPEYACEALRKVGCCSEETYPYEKPIERSTRPPAHCYAEAEDMGMDLCEFIELSPGDCGVDLALIHATLRGTEHFAERGVTCGLPIFPSFFQTDETGFVMDPSDEEKEWGPLGYHLMALVGCFVLEIEVDGCVIRRTYYIVKNSWGAGFGDHGYIYISEAYIASLMMCCVAPFHRSEIESWENLSMAPSALARSRKANSEPWYVAAVIVACAALAIVALALLPPEGIADTSSTVAMPPPVSRKSQDVLEHESHSHVRTDPQPKSTNEKNAAPVPTWGDLRQRLEELLWPDQ